MTTVAQSVIDQLSNEIAALITTIAVAKAKASNIAKLAAQIDPSLWLQSQEDVMSLAVSIEDFEKVRTLLETIAAG